MNEKNKEGYIFACAVVRGREKELLNQDEIGKLLEESIRDSGAEYEEKLTLEQQRAYDLVKGLAPEPELLSALLFPGDYHNLKVLMKSEFLGREQVQDYLVGTGTIAPQKMAEFLRERNYADLTVEMRRGVEQVLELFVHGPDPRALDFIFDRACYGDVVKAAEASENAFLQGYVRLLIDTLNIKTFVRIRKMGKEETFFSKVFLEGGNISKHLFLNGFETPLNRFAESLLSYGFQSVVEEGAASLERTGQFAVLEKLCDDRMMNYTKDVKYMSYGPEPLIAYLIATDSGLKNRRIILAGRLAGLTTLQIRERVRNTYV